jgi:transposase
MPAERLPMRKVREVLRLKHACGASERLIADSIGISRSTVAEYLRRAAVIGLTWPVPEGIDDAELERRLFTPASFEAKPARPMPDWNRVHAELRRRGVTLLLLWREHRAEHAEGHGYSRFCDLYQQWRKGLSATMRQTHGAGEKLFVDFAGDTVPVIDPTTDEVRLAKAVVCDNLKAGVTKPSRYEPGVNRTYQELAAHYGFAILPTRVRKPRDKAKVEVAVQIVERFVLARLRDRRFFSLEELNAAIRECVAELNAKVMRRFGKSRNELLEEVDRPALKPLPAERYCCGSAAGSARTTTWRSPVTSTRPLRG